MANQPGCYQSFKARAIRASRLNADGTLDQGVMLGSAYNMRPISVALSPVVTTGDRFEQKDGSGNLCVVIENPDKTTGYDITLTLCQLDIELIEILTGADVILDPGDANVIIGFIAPGPDDDTLPTEFHVWSDALNGSEQVASPYAYWHWVFPYVKWNLGAQTLENGILQLTLTGKASTNSNIGGGSFNDLPTPITSYFGVYLADDLPDTTVAPYSDYSAVCGYVDTPAASS